MLVVDRFSLKLVEQVEYDIGFPSLDGFTNRTQSIPDA